MCFRYKFLEKVVRNFKVKGYNFKHVAEMNIIRIVKKLDMSCDFFIIHNLHAVECKLFSMNNKDKNLLMKINRNKWRHPLIRKHSQIPFSI